MSIKQSSELSVSGSSTSKTSDSGISRTKIFDLLSNKRRVFALEYLEDHDGESTFKEIVEGVAAREYNTNFSSKERNRVYASLSQTHVPTLKEEGVIEYDRKTGDITLTDRASDVMDYLRPQSTLQRIVNTFTSALSA